MRVTLRCSSCSVSAESWGGIFLRRLQSRRFGPGVVGLRRAEFAVGRRGSAAAATIHEVEDGRDVAGCAAVDVRGVGFRSLGRSLRDLARSEGACVPGLR